MVFNDIPNQLVQLKDEEAPKRRDVFNVTEYVEPTGDRVGLVANSQGFLKVVYQNVHDNIEKTDGDVWHETAHSMDWFVRHTVVKGKTIWLSWAAKIARIES